MPNYVFNRTRWDGGAVFCFRGPHRLKRRQTSRNRSMKRLLSLLIVAAASAGAEPQTALPKQPFFQLPVQAKQTLMEKAETLRSGDSYQTVVSRLGAPTYDQVLMRKENSRIIGRSLRYYAVIWESGLVNEIHDELVDVILDEKDRVRSVHIKVKVEK